MRAMILAAGRGERLRPLTDRIPKPLIEVAGKPLIIYHIENLRQAGITDIVINTAWLADKIHQRLGDGSDLGVDIRYSDEDTALETAGGIVRALPLLGQQPFLVINGDIWTDFTLSSLPQPDDELAHLVMVDNPSHNPDGDFALDGDRVRNHGDRMLTFSGIGIYRPQLFLGLDDGARPLAPLLRAAADEGRIAGRHHGGRWTDAGTAERLHELETSLRQ